MSDDIDEAYISQLIYNELQSHLDFVEVFNAVCDYLKYKRVETSFIRQWVKDVSLYRNIKEIESKYYKLILEINSNMLSIIHSLVEKKISSGSTKFNTFNTVYERLGCVPVSNKDMCKIFKKPQTYSDDPKRIYLHKAVMKINNFYDEFITEAVRKDVELKRNRLQIFERLYFHFNNIHVSMEEIKNWIDCFDRHCINSENPRVQEIIIKIGEDNCELIKTVMQKYRIYYNVICLKNIEMNHKLPCLLSHSSRYVIQFDFTDNDEMELKILDLFHGQLIKFTIDDLHFNTTVNSDQLKIVDFFNNQLFVIFKETRAFYLYLINIDFKFKKCDVIQKHGFQFKCGLHCDVIYDESDSSSFAMCNYSRLAGPQRCIFGQLKEDKFSVDENGILLFGEDYKYKRLVGGVFFGLKLEVNNRLGRNEVKRICYWSKYSNGGIRHEFQFQLDKDFDMTEPIEFNYYSWVKDVCYITNGSNVYTFDVNTRKCLSVFFDGMQIDIDRFINKDHILTTKNDKYYYRFWLRKPDSLLNLTWFNIRRQAILFEKMAYQNALKKLPFELQPFGVSN